MDVRRKICGIRRFRNAEQGLPLYMTTFPDDADNAVLANLARHGIDLTQPLSIEFPIAVPNETSANNAAAAMTKAGYEAQIEYDGGEPDFDPNTDDANEFGPSWTVYANVQLIPEYNEIIRIQTELDQIVQPWGGKSDGWGVMLGRVAQEKIAEQSGEPKPPITRVLRS
jgi:hypothetical protein